MTRHLAQNPLKEGTSRPECQRSSHRDSSLTPGRRPDAAQFFLVTCSPLLAFLRLLPVSPREQPTKQFTFLQADGPSTSHVAAMSPWLTFVTALLALASLSSGATLAPPPALRPLPPPSSSRRLPRPFLGHFRRSTFTCLPPFEDSENPWACWWCVRDYASCPGYCTKKACIFTPFVIDCLTGARLQPQGKSNPEPIFIPPPLLPGGSGFACAVGKLVERIKCCPWWRKCPEKCSLCGLSFYECPKFCRDVSPSLKPYENRGDLGTTERIDRGKIKVPTHGLTQVLVPVVQQG